MFEYEDNDEKPVYVGEIAIDCVHPEAPIGNVSYWIGEEFQKQGYAQQALLQLIQWARTNTRLQKLKIFCEINNEASIKVCQGVKAKFVGRILECELDICRKNSVLEFEIVIN